MKKKPILGVMMIILCLGTMEMVASVYFFQRGPYASPFAVLEVLSKVKGRMIQSGLLRPKSINLYVGDDRFGCSLKSNTKAYPDYCGSQVTYTTNSNNGRFIPKPKDPVGQILFLGDSNTFGHCVNDNENYPFILATEYWQNWEVRNLAVSGWGTSQAYLALSDSLKGDRPPSLVIYGMIPHHLNRNYLGRRWLHQIADNWKRLPHFEVINGDLVYQGTVGMSSAVEDSPELFTKEIELTSAFLRTMQQTCAEKNIPFIIVFLPPTSSYPVALFDTVYSLKIPFLDLGSIEYEGLSADNQHPNPMDHKRIATAIAKSFVSNTLTNLDQSVK